MNLPCLCGDPYCWRCGDPRAAFLADVEAEAGLHIGSLEPMLRALLGKDPEMVKGLAQMILRDIDEAAASDWCDRQP